jgi:TRAP-type mannitol/chloroaromatic compound transport system permease small subunit
MVSDVVLRYVVHAPLVWAYDFISWYPMVALFFFSVSDSWRTGHHVRVDLLVRRLDGRHRAIANLLGTTVAFIVVVLIFYTGLLSFSASYAMDESLSGALLWPLWPAKLMVPIGAGLFALRLLLDFATDFLVFLGFDVQPTHLRGGDIDAFTYPE